MKIPYNPSFLERIIIFIFWPIMVVILWIMLLIVAAMLVIIWPFILIPGLIKFTKEVK